LLDLWSRNVLDLLPKSVEAEVPAAKDAPADIDNHPPDCLKKPAPEPGTAGQRGPQPSPSEAALDGDGPAFEPV
jgi:hypothetical protein